MILLGVGNAIQDWLPCPTVWSLENNGYALPHQTCHCKSKCCETGTLLVWSILKLENCLALTGTHRYRLFLTRQYFSSSHHCRYEKREQTSICISWVYMTVQSFNYYSGTEFKPLWYHYLFFHFVVPEKQKKLETRIWVCNNLNQTKVLFIRLIRNLIKTR